MYISQHPPSPVKKWNILWHSAIALEPGFTAHMPLLIETTAIILWRMAERHQSSPEQCYLHNLHSCKNSISDLQ